MPWSFNPRRIEEIITEENVQRAAKYIVDHCTKDVFLAALYFWGFFLMMAGSMLLVVRIALSLPLPWGR